MNTRLSVIIPAYNEEKRIGKTLDSVRAYLAKQDYESEIMVVSDGSTDATSAIVKGLAKTIPGIRFVEYQPNRGKGYAVRTGMLAAKGEYRLFMDADGSTGIEQVEKLLPFFSQGFDIAIGSRRVSGSEIRTEQPWYRLALGRIFRGLVDAVIPLGVVDSQNGFKAFNTNAAQDIFSRQTTDGFAFDIEVLASALHLGYKVKEVPIVWNDDRQSKVTFPKMAKMLWEIVKIMMRRA